MLQHYMFSNETRTVARVGTGSGWLSMRLNKEPPDDIPVVDFIGVADQASARWIPPRSLPTVSRPRSLGREDSKKAAPREQGRGANSGGAGTNHTPIVVDAEENGDADTKADLTRIKGEELDDDDSCVICLSGERNEITGLPKHCLRSTLCCEGLRIGNSLPARRSPVYVQDITCCDSTRVWESMRITADRP